MSSIKVTLYDAMTPLLDELIARDVGLAQEALQAGGSKVMIATRRKMKSMGTYWHQSFKGGKRKVYKNTNVGRILGSRSDQSDGSVMRPPNIANLIHFYLSKGSRSVIVGGAHPRFQPKQYKYGRVIGNEGKAMGSVGSESRSILHKLNTGEVTGDHPYKDDKWGLNNRFVKGRRFMEKGFVQALPGAISSIEKRYHESFRVAVNNMPIKSVVRKIV